MATGLEADSPFEEDVAEVIRSMGYLADPQVGEAGFRIDIGVRHPERPGQFLLAVECDGATYHSALWARERDRLRQDVLEGLGWTFHRIWSTDWFHNRPREMARLGEALQMARTKAEAGIVVQGANEGAPTMDLPQDEAPVDLTLPELKAPPYRRHSGTVSSALEPHEAPLAILAPLVLDIVQVEGPIHVDEIARRISTAFGKARTGSRIAEAASKALDLARKRDPSLVKDGTFVMTAAQKAAPPVRDRSAETGSLIKAEALPPQEIRAAADLIRQESGEIGDEDLIRAVARLLGFLRVGSELSTAIAEAIRS